MMEILVATAKQRFQLLTMYKAQCPPELEEPWHTIVFAATRTEVPEFRELTNQLMLLYGEEWGRLANVDAHGLANQRVVRKLTIFANDTLVKQYLQDVMGPEFDPEICFASTSGVVIDDDHSPQNAAQMERELAALRAAASATAPLSAAATAAAAAKGEAGKKPADDPFPSTGDDDDAQFRPVEDDVDSDDHNNNNNNNSGGVGVQVPGDVFPDPPADLASAPTLPPVVKPVTAPSSPAPPVVPTSPPTTPQATLPPYVQMTLSPAADVQNNLLIHQETIASVASPAPAAATTPVVAAESAANDLLARFEALKPKRSNATPAAVAPSAPPPEEDSATLDLLMSFPIVSSSGDVQPPASSPPREALTDGGGGDDATTPGDGDDTAGPLLPSVPGDDDDNDDDVGGLHLPRAPTSDLGRGIKSGSKEEKQLDEMDDLAARFERLKKGGR
jgi:hypothetical protein